MTRKPHFRVEEPCGVVTLDPSMSQVRLIHCAHWLWLLVIATSVCAQTSAPPAKLQSKQGSVDFSKAATTNWNVAPLGQPLAHYDRLRTLELSEAAVQLADYSVLRLAELSQLEMVPPREAAAKARFHFQ